MSPNAKSIANYFIEKANSSNRDITILALVKLVYIAHGFILAITDRSYLNPKFDVVEAWKYGPVVPCVYHALSYNGRNPIKAKIIITDGNKVIEPEIEDDYIKKILDLVWDKYGSLSAGRLVDILHRPGSPWWEVYEEGRNNIIPDELIKRHYKGVIDSVLNRVAS